MTDVSLSIQIDETYGETNISTNTASVTPNQIVWLN